jgi:hypothetical protein
MTDADHQPLDASTSGQSPDSPLPSPRAAGPASDHTAPAYLQPPRLGVIHLLAWMTVAAVMFKINRAVRPAGPTTIDWAHFVWMVRELAIAAAITGEGIILAAKYRGLKGRIQPGHFLLFYCGVLPVQEWLFPVPMPDAFLVLFEFSIVFVNAVVPFCFALRMPEKGRWTTSLLILGATNLLLAVIESPTISEIIALSASSALRSVYLSVYLYLAPFRGSLAVYALTIAFLAVAAMLDCLRKSKRDWLHWLGVCATLMNYIWWLFMLIRSTISTGRIGFPLP